MSPLDTRKYLAAFVRQIQAGEPVTDEQREYFAEVFDRISQGEDANAVLGLKFEVGKTEDAAQKRQKMSLILHWISGAINKSDLHETDPYTLDAACVRAVEVFSLEFDASYLKKQWYNYQHMQDPIRTWRDEDSPFYP
jgi:hypothetical protein